MIKYATLLVTLLLFLATLSFAQTNLSDYEGQWVGTFDDPNAFHLEINIATSTDQQYNFKVSNGQKLIHKTGQYSSNGIFEVKLGYNTSFTGSFNTDQSEITGFIKSGFFQFHIALKKNKQNTYTGFWNILMVDRLSPATVYFLIENVNGEQYEAYPIFADQRFRGTWTANFQKRDNLLSFMDLMGGLEFKAVLLENKIELYFLLGEAELANVSFVKTEENWSLGNSNVPHHHYIKPVQQEDGWNVSDLKSVNIDPSQLQRMSDSIYANTLTNVHSVLIAKKGALVYEKYFSQFNGNVPHDQRSANKSITSALLGIAIDQKKIKNVDQSIYDFIPAAYQYTKSEEKAAINLQSLLTMSSGIDAIDFGINRNSAAAEDNFQQTDDWLKTVLEAPMIGKPNEHANYGSANPFLLGYVLDKAVDQPLQNYIDEHLFSPLGISNYVLNSDNTGKLYFAGGMYLTPRDMLKFGELYRCDGIWNDKRIISKEWVKASTKNYLALENTDEKNGYGYLWWQDTYEVNGKKFKSFEARGAGGQVIVVIPDLEIVAVITSGNYRNGRYWQPQMIMREYILPALVNEKTSSKQESSTSSSH